MEKLFCIAGVFLCFTVNCFGQIRHKTNFRGKDSTVVPSINKFEKQNYEYPFLQKENLSPEDNFLLYYNPKIYFELNTQMSTMLLSRNLRLTNDPLYYYKKNMTRLLTLRYADYNKYDLGIIGRYLGLSRKAFAIILAILSIK